MDPFVVSRKGRALIQVSLESTIFNPMKDLSSMPSNNSIRLIRSHPCVIYSSIGMGLTPLEGLVGGTRSGSIDPTLVFHIVKDCSSDAGLPGLKVTKAEAVLNK